jgi:hypothetical protein
VLETLLFASGRDEQWRIWEPFGKSTAEECPEDRFAGVVL